MKRTNFKKIAKKVIDDEAIAIKKLKKSINNSFDQAVHKILNRKNGKVIFSGTGKSGIAGILLSSTFSSVGIPSFFIDANEASHGSLGAIEKNDILVLISYSGETPELKNIISYSRRRKITIIGIVSKKNSTLFKASDIRLLIPEVKEADPNSIVPTSSTLITLSIGHCLCIATMKYKKFGKLDFKKFHPSGSLGFKLKTVGELMYQGKNIPFIDENSNIKSALKVFNKKNLGVLIAKNNKGNTTGIISDGDFKRINYKSENINNLIIKKVMKKNPILVNENMLAAEALSIMNNKKITALCVFKNNKRKTTGLIHMHSILNANIT
mgnify:CR=1 FL=1|tara:strand:+ start:4146 stop:5120 length:975 start_codon:yes stop_codon:yes gene_type:complete